jgi:hypothetical protein
MYISVCAFWGYKDSNSAAFHTHNMANKRKATDDDISPKPKKPRAPPAPTYKKLLDIFGGVEHGDLYREDMTDAVTAKNNDELKGILHKFGVAVAPAVMEPDEVATCVQGMHAVVESIGASAGLTTPGSGEEWETRFGIENGEMAHTGSAGASPPSWVVRTHPRIREIFRELYGKGPDHAMFTSQDGFSYRVPSDRKLFSPTSRSWLHSDCRLPGGEGKDEDEDEVETMYQGQVPLTDVRPGCNTFLCLPGAHQLMPRFADAFPGMVGKANWLKYNEEHLRWFADHGCSKLFAVTCPPGSLILWDSKLPHSSIQGTDTAFARMVVYVCQRPTDTVPKPVRKRAATIFNERRTGTHSTDKMFGAMPNTHGDKSILPITGSVFVDPLGMLPPGDRDAARALVGMKPEAKSE